MGMERVMPRAARAAPEQRGGGGDARAGGGSRDAGEMEMGSEGSGEAGKWGRGAASRHRDSIVRMMITTTTTTTTTTTMMMMVMVVMMMTTPRHNGLGFRRDEVAAVSPGRALVLRHARQPAMSCGVLRRNV